MPRIKIDIDRTIGTINPNVYGGFVEHLGRCIYGGMYEEGSPLSDERGFRKDVLEALKALRMPNLRYPGGNFVSGYHWEDGVGPKDERPRKKEFAWHTVESNRLSWHLVEPRQTDDSRHLQLKANGLDVVLTRLFVDRCQLTQLAPTLKVGAHVLIVLVVDHLGAFAIQ